ncbi:MAG: hypothetical protein IPP94_15205 [Ignavibacteria bacterium]|nr:hypothetical protein [Ignavibacteria bacterium]
MPIRVSSSALRSHAVVAALVGIVFLASPVHRADAQFRATIGTKAWYTTWNIPLRQSQGIELSNLTPALLAGPYLNLRFGKVAATVMYSTALVTYHGTERSDGMFYDFAFDGKIHVDRQDINVFLNYTVTPEVTVFANVKLLSYTMREAVATIYEHQLLFTQDFNGTGFGLGAQFTVPFSGSSPLYSFMSTGAFTNTVKQENMTLELDKVPVPLEQEADSNTELLYFLDAGLGMRFPDTKLGVAIGLRVENGVDTKTAIGPTANIFYTF